jgi:hypothetical protein
MPILLTNEQWASVAQASEIPVRCEEGPLQALKIILLCIASAVVYGVCHDQVTARVCVEYFTVGHEPIFPTESATLLALGFGTMATWWIGLIFGALAALVSRAGSWPKVDAARWIRPIACLLAVMAVASLLAGITGYQLAKASGFVLPEPFGPRVPKGRHGLLFATANEAFLLNIVLTPWLVTGLLYLAAWAGKRSAAASPGRAGPILRAAIGPDRTSDSVR